MNVVQNVRSFVSSFFQPKEEVKLEDVGLVDVYLEYFLTKFSRKDVANLVMPFFILNSGIFILLLWSPNFYGLVGVVALALFVLDWMYRDGLYAKYTGKYRLEKQKLNVCMEKFVSCICISRKESPHFFYPLMILLFWSLFWVSRVPVNYVLTPLLIIFLITAGTKAIFINLPESASSKVQEFFSYVRLPPNILEEGDLFYLPSIIRLIMRKGLDNSDSQNVPDEMADSFVSGLSPMPSYLEVAAPAVEIEEEDLIPLQSAVPGVSLTPGDLSSDSDSDHKDIKFDSDHFNTSSSEDDPLVKNLPKITQVPLETEAVGMFRSVINTVGGSMVANMFQSAVYSRLPESKKKVPSESDSSDFELVDADDIDNDMQKSK